MILLEGLLKGLLIAFAYVGVVIIVGFIIGGLSRLFSKLLSYYSYKAAVITGAIGTPIHELGHALFCIIFGHHIDEIKLFKPNSDDGVLGYVHHSYNPKNLYHKIGNFFIGVGPIILGSFVLLGLLFLLSNDSFAVLISVNNFFINEVPVEIRYLPNYFIGGYAIMISEFFKLSNFTSFTYWIFLLFCLLIGSHLNLSKADIQNAKTGLVLTIVTLILIPFISSLFGRSSLNIVSGYLLSGAVFMSCIYLLSIIASIVNVILGLIIRIILKIFKKI